MSSLSGNRFSKTARTGSPTWNRVSDLRHERIEKIERDIAAFANEVEQMVLAIAPELADQEPQDAVLELERRLADSMKAFELAAAIDQKLSDARQKSEQCAQTLNDARLDIENLQRAARVNSVDDLRAAIGRSDRLRSSQRELDAVKPWPRMATASRSPTLLPSVMKPISTISPRVNNALARNSQACANG
jgi:hypothetical protein